MLQQRSSPDVLCIGHASYDLVFSVPHHPGADEKIQATALISCGGGPAANAAIQIAKLGYSAAFSGYLGMDAYGFAHFQELLTFGIDTHWLNRGDSPTPLSVVMVKNDGQRALVNYKGDTQPLTANAIDFSGIQPKVLLFDGHEPQLSLAAIRQLQNHNVPKILDAGSVHDGTLALLDKMDYLVCSEKFAVEYAGNEQKALEQLSNFAAHVVITLGHRGLIWHSQGVSGSLTAPPIKVVDTTGAGDALHGAFAAGLAANMEWSDLLRYASVAGALCCSKMGARPGLANKQEHLELLASWSA